jgi:hypothetical protein
MDYFYLDIGPMIRRLQQNPSEFELRYDRLCHRPSRHQLAVHRIGKGRVVARCNCVEFPIRREQGAALSVAIESWEECYWRPLVERKAAERRMTWINRELTRFFVKAHWLLAIDAIFARLGISAWERQRRISKPRLRIVSSSPDDLKLPAGVPTAARLSRDNQGPVR